MRNKRIVEDYYAHTHTYTHTKLVCAQRTEQTISPTLHGRTRTIASSGSRVCLRVRSYCSGRNGRVTYVTLAIYARARAGMCVCMCAHVRVFVRARTLVPYTDEEYVRLQTASDQRIFRTRVAVGPGRILRVARSLNPPDPSALTSTSPSLLLLSPFLPLPFSPVSGSKTKASPLLHLRRNDSATRMRPSLFPFILVPVSLSRREVRPYSKRVQGASSRA